MRSKAEKERELPGSVPIYVERARDGTVGLVDGRGRVRSPASVRNLREVEGRDSEV